MVSSLPASLIPELDVLKGPRSWIVASHLSPDGDTLGSAIAMAHLLRAFGGTVLHVCPDPVPGRYAFLPGADAVVTHLPEDLSNWGLVTCDAAELSRFGDWAETFAAMPLRVNVDHHVSNPGFGSLNIVLTDAAATGEVVYRLYEHFGLLPELAAAQVMYAAIVTDTGGFAYEATTAETHRIAGELIGRGVSPAWMTQQLFEQVPLSELRIKSQALSQMQRSADGRIVWTLVTQEMMAATGADESQLDGLAEQMRSLQGVDVAFYLRESDRGLKLSLRGKFSDVNRIASRFGGGGHRRAAGATVPGPLSTAPERVLEAVQAELHASETRA
ncbi:Bifunctional oligoribonuclease and PAP phosphatase NrnA [compost metagenome]